MRYRSIGLSIMLVLSFALGGFGEAYSGSAFDLGASARALGMGNAFSALVDDETAIYHNPAALGWLDGLGVSSLFVQQFGGISYGSISLSMPWVGANIAILDSGPISSPDGVFRYTTEAVTLGVGVPIGPLAVGVRWQLIAVSSPTSGVGWSFDPAVLLDLGSLRLSAMLEAAVAGAVRYDSGATETFESSLTLGIAASLSPSPDVWWSASFDAARLFSPAAQFGAGLEAWIGAIGARVGYDGVGPTLGLSIRWEALQFDWAFALRGDIGGSHRASLRYRF